MEQHEEELVKTLAPGNPELKEAWEKHSRLKSAVDTLVERGHLTEAEQVEKKNLQKEKLIQKDIIQKILSEHRESHSPPGA